MVQISGYANRVVTLKFEKLSEPGDLVHVVMRNPKLLPLDELKPGKDVVLDAQGVPLDPDAAEADMYERLAKLVIGWHVYDAVLTGEDMEAIRRGEEPEQRLLPNPATADAVRRLPNAVQRAMIGQVENILDPS